ncbi:hypothetical protein OE847_003747 [Salmonella enterica]|nr:hypothetical protein [Salmonella enterica]EDX0904668.1 hypothetical protein [Salmonella enterica subsp. enterica]EBD7338789.1 hypothetical protein [Salmonella enterica]ECP2052819.1 hypothetical protein [Salmonella enterica]ECX5291069.1 hypothetical protein [Salmonella enterica]
MRRLTHRVTGLLATALLLVGCSTPAEYQGRSPAEVEQGMLGDLNHYLQQLLKQRAAGNADAERALVRLLAGQGLPAPEITAANRNR